MTSRTLHLSLICRFGSAPIDTFRVNLVNKRLVCDEEGTAYQVNVSAPFNSRSVCVSTAERLKPSQALGLRADFGQKRNRSQESSVVAQCGSAYLHLPPGRPGMFLHVGFDKRNDHIGTFHDSAAHDNELGIVGVDQSHGINGPDFEAAISDCDRDLISSGSFIE